MVQTTRSQQPKLIAGLCLLRSRSSSLRALLLTASSSPPVRGHLPLLFSTDEVTSAINYFYFHCWRRLLNHNGNFWWPPFQVSAPLFFAYAGRRIEPFHCDDWLRTVQASPRNRVMECDSGHWLMRSCSGAINEEVYAWLQDPLQ